MKTTTLPPFTQQLKKRLDMKGKRHQEIQNGINIEISFQEDINEEMDNAVWLQLLKILKLEDNTYYTQ